MGMHRIVQRKKLEELIDLIDTYDQENEEKSEDDENSSNCLDDHLSTGISEEEDPLFERKKKRRKVKESELTTNE